MSIWDLQRLALVGTVAGAACAHRPLPQWDAAGPIAEVREETEAAPEDVGPLLRYAAMAEGNLRADPQGLLGLDHAAVAEDVVGRLQACSEGLEEEAGRCEAALGRLLVVLGRPDSAEQALRRSLHRHQTLEALGPLLDLLVVQGRVGELAEVCAAERRWLAFEGNVVALWDACVQRGVPLSVASPEDQRAWRALEEARRYKRSFAHEVRWADPERLREAYGVELGPPPEDAEPLQ